MAKKKAKVNVPEGDKNNGQKIFESQCGVCHSVMGGDDKTSAAPHLSEIVGRKSGSTNFPYSNALKKAKLVWDRPNLFQYLLAPGKFIPGNRMSFGGLKDPQERADVIAYLENPE
jgi:cytochrome c